MRASARSSSCVGMSRLPLDGLQGLDFAVRNIGAARLALGDVERVDDASLGVEAARIVDEGRCLFEEGTVGRRLVFREGINDRIA